MNDLEIDEDGNVPNLEMHFAEWEEMLIQSLCQACDRPYPKSPRERAILLKYSADEQLNRGER